MSAKDLITLSRAKQAIQSITDSSQDSLLAVLITAASDGIEKYCRRYFVARAFDEVYSGDGDRRLLLRQYPIQSVSSVRYRPVTVVKITNTVAANVQARAAVTSTGLVLTRSNAGLTTTDTSITWAGNPTLSALASAVTALGAGWLGQVVGDSINYGSWASADLYIPPAYGDGVQSQGALQCVNGSFAELKMHTYELAGYQWDGRGWLLRAIPYTDPELLHPEDLVFPVGVNNFRVQYTAGYSTIPEAVQEACAEWVSILYWLTQRDPGLKMQNQPGQISQSWESSTGAGGVPPPGVRTLLAPFRRHTVATNQG